MNKLKFLISIFVLCSFQVIAQNTDEQIIDVKSLSKSWEAIDVINPEKTEDELKELLSFIEALTLDFNEDLSYTISFALDLKGTWKLKDNVIYTSNKKGDNKWVIHVLEKNKLILSRNEAKQKIVFKSKN